MKRNQGISLIVLVITIIVMIILAGAVVITLSNSGIISKANNAVKVTDLNQVQDLASMLWADAYIDGARTEVDLGTVVVNGLNEVEGLNVNDYIVHTTASGVTVEKADYKYYSTLSGAVNDVNNGTIGENADATKGDAVAGVTVNSGNTYVTLFKDTVESNTIECKGNMTLILSGNTVTFDGTSEIGFDILSGNLTIDGKRAESCIKFTDDTSGLRLLEVSGECEVKLNGGNYSMKTVPQSNATPSVIMIEKGNLEMANCKIVGDFSQTAQKSCSGIYVAQDGSASIANTDVDMKSTTYKSAGIANLGILTVDKCNIVSKDGVEDVWGIINYNEATLKGSTIKGFANCTNEVKSFGISNQPAGKMSLENCHVIGVDVGVASAGMLDINGGIYEGYLVGGVGAYGTNITMYLQNATIRECELPEGYIATDESEHMAFGIQDGPSDDNIKVYMNNCDIWGSKDPICLIGGGGEHNNTLYISNSRINLDYTGVGVKIGHDTHRVEIGRGCNFTSANSDRPSSVVVTDKVYVR